jgi:hypothetical protein
MISISGDANKRGGGPRASQLLRNAAVRRKQAPDYEKQPPCPAIDWPGASRACIARIEVRAKL